MSKLDTDNRPFVDLMALGGVFVVPDYHRPYSWKANKQVTELWGDMARLYRSVFEDGKEDTHFICSVVFGKAATNTLGAVECAGNVDLFQWHDPLPRGLCFIGHRTPWRERR